MWRRNASRPGRLKTRLRQCAPRGRLRRGGVRAAACGASHHPRCRFQSRPMIVSSRSSTARRGADAAQWACARVKGCTTCGRAAGAPSVRVYCAAAGDRPGSSCAARWERETRVFATDTISSWGCAFEGLLSPPTLRQQAGARCGARLVARRIREVLDVRLDTVAHAQVPVAQRRSCRTQPRHAAGPLLQRAARPQQLLRLLERLDCAPEHEVRRCARACAGKVLTRARAPRTRDTAEREAGAHRLRGTPPQRQRTARRRRVRAQERRLRHGGRRASSFTCAHEHACPARPLRRGPPRAQQRRDGPNPSASDPALSHTQRPVAVVARAAQSGSLLLIQSSATAGGRWTRAAALETTAAAQPWRRGAPADMPVASADAAAAAAAGPPASASRPRRLAACARVRRAQAGGGSRVRANYGRASAAAERAGRQATSRAAPRRATLHCCSATAGGWARGAALTLAVVVVAKLARSAARCRAEAAAAARQRRIIHLSLRAFRRSCLRRARGSCGSNRPVQVRCRQRPPQRLRHR